MSSNSRQKNYKHQGLDSEELRKRREDLNISLRKIKREEQVRNYQSILCHDLLSFFSISNAVI
jgi:hypothetical protein